MLKYLFSSNEISNEQWVTIENGEEKKKKIKWKLIKIWTHKHGEGKKSPISLPPPKCKSLFMLGVKPESKEK